MSLNEGIMWLMAMGIVIGAADRILGNRFGLGEKFEEGFQAMGALALGMVGMMSLTPIIAEVTAPIIGPFFGKMGADPSIFAGMLLPIDAGGYALAMELALDEQAGFFSGIIVASMLGGTIAFVIPVGLNIIAKEEHDYFSKGLLVGLISIPVGAVVGGMVAKLPIKVILYSSLPVAVLAALLALGLYLVPGKMVKGCSVFGRLITILITIGLAAAALEALVGWVVIPGMAPISEGLEVVGAIGVVLLGTFPILTLLTRLCRKPLGWLGKRFGINMESTAGLIFALANPIPVFNTFQEMDERGKIINIAWVVCATAALGDHLGFVAGVYPAGITAMIVGKLAGGIFAVGLALFITRNTLNQANR